MIIIGMSYSTPGSGCIAPGQDRFDLAGLALAESVVLSLNTHSFDLRGEVHLGVVQALDIACICLVTLCSPFDALHLASCLHK